MKKRTVITTIVLIALTGLAVIAFFLFPAIGKTTLRLTVMDAVSRSWVYNSSITIQNRVIRGFKSTVFSFSDLKPGTYPLVVTAPYYTMAETGLTIHPGENILTDPILLSGYEIPDLDDIALFEGKKDDTLELDFRLVRPDGHAVVNHPCLPVVIYCRISEQTDTGQRGDIIYAAPVPWHWNTSLTETYRYEVAIPLDDIGKSQAPYWIMDYLVLFPDPRTIGEDEIKKIILTAQEMKDIDSIASYLDGFSDRLRWFFRSHNNVENMFGEGGT
ncbi:MAG: carboxypeptidase regulatory-like domain-containing protein [Spirochaetales bacterium]|nr:carboxypeptidase regulatory-like domain-containing protein [Spirochaetales bacterium]